VIWVWRISVWIGIGSDRIRVWGSVSSKVREIRVSRISVGIKSDVWDASDFVFFEMCTRRSFFYDV